MRCRWLCVVGLGLLAVATQCWSTAYRWPVNGHYYEPVLAPAGITWTAANAAAIAAGGYLATILTPEENAFVYSLISDDERFWHQYEGNRQTGPWLGGFQPPGSEEPDGGWEWVTGELWGYTSWATGEPNNWRGIEHYLHFWSYTSAFAPTWNDNADDGAKPVGYIVECNGTVAVEGATWGHVKELFR